MNVAVNEFTAPPCPPKNLLVLSALKLIRAFGNVFMKKPRIASRLKSNCVLGDTFLFCVLRSGDSSPELP